MERACVLARLPAARFVLVEGLFGDERLTEHDPFTSVAGGLAIANYHDWRHLTARP